MRAKPSVLIVEDDDELRKVISGLIGEAGYQVTTAVNGREALDLLIDGKVMPALILLDLRMPVMDGWEFTRVVRCYKRLAEIPIVVISTPNPGASRWHPSADGALAKPFSPNALMAEIEKHARLDTSPTPT